MTSPSSQHRSRRVFLLQAASAAAFFATPARAAKLTNSTHNYRPELGAASPALDITTSKGLKNAPVMIFVHGGAWAIGSRRAVQAKPSFFSGLGFVFISLDYRLVPKVSVQDQLGDIDAALGWVRDNVSRFGGDPGNLHLLGHSAGAHLVSMTGVAPRAHAASLIRARALRSVISNDTRAYDIPRIAVSARGGRLPRLYRRAFGTNPETWQALSPMYQLNSPRKLPDFLLMVSGQGSGDTRDAFAADFATLLRRYGGRVSIFDGQAYSHRDINVKIGTAPDISGAIRRFLSVVV